MNLYERIHEAAAIEPAAVSSSQVEALAEDLADLVKEADRLNAYERRAVQSSPYASPRILPTRSDYDALERVKIIKHCLAVRAGWVQPMSTGNAEHQAIIDRTINAL